jgi:hypothetical protein
MSPVFDTVAPPSAVWHGWAPAPAKPLEVSFTLATGQKIRCGFLGDGPRARVWVTSKTPQESVAAATPGLLQHLANTAHREVRFRGKLYHPKN